MYWFLDRLIKPNLYVKSLWLEYIPSLLPPFNSLNCLCPLVSKMRYAGLSSVLDTRTLQQLLKTNGGDKGLSKKIFIILSVYLTGGSSMGRVLICIVFANIGTKRNNQPYNPVLYECYQRKYQQRSKRITLGAVMKKITDIIFAVLL